MGARWKGINSSLRNYEKLKDDAARALRSSLREEGEEIATDVKASRPGKGVPKDEGILASSIAVDGPSKTGKPRVFVSAGGQAGSGNQGETNDEDVGYGFVQHEDLTLNHKLGEAKYFIRAVERRQKGGTAADALAEQLRAVKGVS